MLKTGSEHLEQLRDGRIVYIGNEKVDDVTTHPAFAKAARTVAAMYDVKAAPARFDDLTFEEDGERYSAYFLQARSRDDLRKRMRVHQAIADVSYGMFGRSPDHVASFVTGMAISPDILKTEHRDFRNNLLGYYEHLRKNDLYPVYAVLPPQAARDPEYYERQNLPIPSLQVVREEDDGIVISGMKMLATGGVLANEIWIGNLIPLASSQTKQAVTCAVPVNIPGLTLWSRQPLELNAANEFDSPLSWRFDETDSMVMCEDVKVPWERVFVMDDPDLSRNIYIQTPSHCYGNHQSNVRFLSKLKLIIGLANRVVKSTGADKVPAVRETLGRLAALEAGLAGMVCGQIESGRRLASGLHDV